MYENRGELLTRRQFLVKARNAIKVAAIIGGAAAIGIPTIGILSNPRSNNDDILVIENFDEAIMDQNGNLSGLHVDLIPSDTKVKDGVEYPITYLINSRPHKGLGVALIPGTHYIIGFMRPRGQYNYFSMFAQAVVGDPHIGFYIGTDLQPPTVYRGDNQRTVLEYQIRDENIVGEVLIRPGSDYSRMAVTNLIFSKRPGAQSP